MTGSEPVQPKVPSGRYRRLFLLAAACATTGAAALPGCRAAMSAARTADTVVSVADAAGAVRKATEPLPQFDPDWPRVVSELGLLRDKIVRAQLFAGDSKTGAELDKALRHLEAVEGYLGNMSGRRE